MLRYKIRGHLLKLKQPKGFTVLELLIAMAIIGLMVTTAFSIYSFYTDISNVKMVENDVKRIAQYIEEHRNCPPNTSGYVSQLIYQGILPNGMPRLAIPVGGWYFVVCGPRGRTVQVWIPSTLRKYQNYFDGNYYTRIVSWAPKYIDVYYTQVFAPLGDAGYERKNIFLQ